jgi:LytR cell envelope-related transcriptional attenuator
MGRHSSHQQGPYVRSILTWAVPWLVVAIVVGAAVWVAVDAVGGDGVSLDTAPPSPSPRPSASPSATESPVAVVASPTPARKPSPEPSPEPSHELSPEPSPKKKRREKERDEPGLVTQGITVQVLNGTGGVEGAAEAMADRLAQLGYQVEAVTDGLTVSQSVVYWSAEDSREAATALAEHFGWIAGPAPSNLSGEVDLHVIVSAGDAGA